MVGFLGVLRGLWIVLYECFFLCVATNCLALASFPSTYAWVHLKDASLASSLLLGGVVVATE